MWERLKNYRKRQRQIILRSEKNKLMKIGIDCRTASTTGGIGEYTRQLLKRLIEQNDSDQFVLFFDDKKTADNFQRQNAVIKIIPLNRFRRFLPIIYSQLIVPLFFLLSSCSVMLFPANIAPWLYRKKFLAVIHDLAVYKFPDFFPDQLFNVDRKFLVPSTLRRAVKLIAVSQSTKNDIISLFKINPNKVSVVYEGGDFFVFDQDQQASLNPDILPNFFFLFLGTIEPRKNILNLLLAYQQLVIDEKCDFDLFLVGKAGWKNHDIFKTIDEINESFNSQRIKYFGYLSTNDKILLYQRAQVLVLPSWYEGFGLPIAEAMYFGLPSIISPYGSLPEIGSDASLIMADGSQAEIYSALKKFIINNNLRQDLSLQALERSKVFSWRLSAEKTIDILREI